jgi:hypothetical protein
MNGWINIYGDKTICNLRLWSSREQAERYGRRRSHTWLKSVQVELEIKR